MKPLSIADVNTYVNNNIITFHKNRLATLERLRLKDILKRKNPYLFRAKDITTGSELVQGFLDAHLSSSEEKSFGDFLEQLAIFVAGKTCAGKKSAATGIDLEFDDNEVHYLVSVKSGPNWGNSSQYKKQKTDFETAIKVLKQNNRQANVMAVLGICYGKTKTTYPKGYMKVYGQNFWYLISKSQDLYIDIIEPLGHKAHQHNSAFLRQKTKIVNQFTQEFLNDFCTGGDIDWIKLVRFNSGNLDLE